MAFTLADLPGFYILTSNGQLGYFGEDKKFNLDTELSRLFATYNASFVKTCLSNHEEAELLLAIIYQPTVKKKWDSESMVFTDDTLRRLYPASQAKTDKLTDFQKRNREVSIYRGMELLLEYRNELFPNEPIHCPVLVSRKTFLGQYRFADEIAAQEPDTNIPAIEAVNLIAEIPIGQRETPELLLLWESIHRNVIKKEVRKPVELSLLEHARKTSPAMPSTADPDFWGRSKYEKKSERELALSGSSDPGRMEQQRGKLEYITVEQLKAFNKFRDLDRNRLSALANKCPLQTAPTGTILFTRGSTDNKNLYLLQGTLQLEAADGGRHLIQGGSEKARHPIANLKPRMFTVTAVTPVKFLFIEDEQEAEILR